MDFALSPEQELLRNTVRGFAKRECTAEYARQVDEEAVFPIEVYRKIAELGWLGLPFPERFGGSDCGAVDLAIVVEELSRGMAAVAIAYLANVVTNGRGILHFGTPDQQNALLPELIAGRLTFATGVTEPDAGSDIASMQTTAERDGDEFVLNGNKMFCTGALTAGLIELAARTDKALPRHKGISVFLVDPKSAGLTIHPIKVLGHRANVTTEISLQDVRVPARNLLGPLNGGWGVLLHSIASEHMGSGAVCVGAAQAAFEEALEHAKRRVQFGQPIGKFQAVQHKLANMEIAIEASRLLLYHCAWLISQGKPCHKETAILKVHASETYMHTALEGMQILAGYGYTMESAMQRHFRDAKLFEFGGGANEIQRSSIARELGL